MSESIRTITIGATGRRHIAPYARNSVVESTLRLFSLLSRVEKVRFILETGLAIGADSIAAKAAFEVNRRTGGNKIGVRAVLPMPRADYEDDFAVDSLPGELSEREAFRSLLAACDEVVELPIVSRDASGAVARGAQYVALADRLVQSSDLLLAYWSGCTDELKPGGTVDVVTRKLRAVHDNNAGVVFAIGTPENKRIKNADGTKSYRPEFIDHFGCYALNSVEFMRFGKSYDALSQLVEALGVNPRGIV